MQAANIVHEGDSKDFHWGVYDNGELVITMHRDANLPDYEVHSGSNLAYSEAPWNSYKDEISSLTIDQTNGHVQRFGRGCFAYLSVDSVRYKNSAGSINILPPVYTVGSKAFEAFNVPYLHVQFQNDATSSQREIGKHTLSSKAPLVNIQGATTLWEYSVSGAHYMVRLGSSVKLLRAGSLKSAYLWHKNKVPSVIFDGVNPPEWQRLVDQGQTMEAGEIALCTMYTLLGVITVGQAIVPMWTAAGNEDQSFYDFWVHGGDREFEYPFGDRPNEENEIICVVPPSAIETYRSFYKANHPEVEYSDYMCAYFTGEHRKHTSEYDLWNTTDPCGRIVAGSAIEVGEYGLYGWWYIDGEELHIGYNGNPMSSGSAYDTPWDNYLDGIKKLYIHDTPSIPDKMFENGKHLGNIEDVYVDDNLKKIGAKAFASSKIRYINRFGTGTVKLELGEKAFYQCKNLANFSTDVEIEYLGGESCFEGCKELARVFLTGRAAGQTYFSGSGIIPAKSFKDCEDLALADLHLVYSIGDNAFQNCKALKEVNLERDGCQVGKQAFAGCTGLRKINFNDRRKELAMAAFSGCTGVEDIFVGWYNTGEPVATLDNFTFGSDVTISNITLHVDAALYKNYENAPVWRDMKIDKEFTYPVKGDCNAGAMYWELSSNGTLTIEPVAWQGNYSAYSSLYYIPDYKNVNETPWYPYREYIRAIMLKSAVDANGNVYGAKKIGKNAFNFEGAESQLTDVHIPRVCKEIGEKAFYANNNLVVIYIDDVETIGDFAFSECSNLNRIDLGAGLKKAGDYIFRNCPKLNQIDVSAIDPAVVSKYTFAEIGNNQSNGPRRSPAAEKATDGQQNVTLNVPDGALNNYITTEYWNKFHFNKVDERYGSYVAAGKFGDGMWILWENGTMTITANRDLTEEEVYTQASTTFTHFTKEVGEATKELIIKGEMSCIGEYNYSFGFRIFKDFKNLERLELSGSIKRVGQGLFRDCSKLCDANLAAMDTIDAGAFAGCAFESISLLTLKKVGDYAFGNNDQLKSIAVETSGEIGSDIFGDCDNLEYVDLGSGKIGEGMVGACKNLKEAVYYGSEVPRGLFKQCENLKKVTLGSQVTQIGYNVFERCYALDTIVISTPTPPAMLKDSTVTDHMVVDDDLHSWSKTVYDPFGNQIIGLEQGEIRQNYRIDHTKIVVSVPETYAPSYRKADLWKEMKINGKQSTSEFPITFQIGDQTWGEVTEKGDLSIRAYGEMDGEPNTVLKAYSTLISRDIEFTYSTRSVKGAYEAEEGAFAWMTKAPQSITFGALMSEIGSYAFYTDAITSDVDFYSYAAVPPTIKANAFKWEVLNANGKKPELTVVDKSSVVAAYKESEWGQHFKIVGGLDEQEALATYTVTFVDGLTGDVIEKQEVKMGKDATLPKSAPEHIGYRFFTWDGDYCEVFKNQTVTAQYAEATCYVVFMVDAEIYSSQEVPYGGDAVRPGIDPVKEGYNFYGWNGSYEHVTTNLTLLAVFGEGEPVKKVTLSPASKSLTLKSSELSENGFQITATIEPSDASLQTLSWKSTNKEVATVDGKGNVTLVGFGKCEIRANAVDGSGQYGKCELEINRAEEPAAELCEVMATDMDVVAAQVLDQDYESTGKVTIAVFSKEGWSYDGSGKLVKNDEDGMILSIVIAPEKKNDLRGIHSLDENTTLSGFDGGEEFSIECREGEANISVDDETQTYIVVLDVTFKSGDKIRDVISGICAAEMPTDDPIDPPVDPQDEREVVYTCSLWGFNESALKVGEEWVYLTQEAINAAITPTQSAPYRVMSYYGQSSLFGWDEEKGLFEMLPYGTELKEGRYIYRIQLVIDDDEGTLYRFPDTDEGTLTVTMNGTMWNAREDLAHNISDHESDYFVDSPVFEIKPQGIEFVNGNDSALTRKLIINGQLFIERNGQIYNATGVQVK